MEMTEDGLLPIERIADKIFLVRVLKVMLDRDLAELYGVETRVLTQAVRRNRRRFPADFMFLLEKQEVDFLMSQSVISKPGDGITVDSGRWAVESPVDSGV